VSPLVKYVIYLSNNILTQERPNYNLLPRTWRLFLTITKDGKKTESFEDAHGVGIAAAVRGRGERTDILIYKT